MNTQPVVENAPVWRGLAIAIAMSGVLAVATGCASWRSDDIGDEQWTEVEPDDEGIFAYDGDDLIRLDGDAEWEQETWEDRANLPGSSEFIFRDPALAETSSDAVELRKVAWVRSTITGGGQITPVSGNQWLSAPVPSLVVPLEYAERSESDPELIRVRARQPLEPGLYALHAQTPEGPRNARFGVAWPETDKEAYAASVCVDRYAGEETAYRLCQEQNLAASEDELQIYLVKPETQDSGSGRSMVISGVILNNSSRPQSVPLLAAELRDPEGRALTRWRFKADSTELEPGQSTSFRTEVDRAPDEVHSVNVNFASTQATN